MNAAEKSAREAVKRDPNHVSPRSDCLLGLVPAAVTELRTFIRLSPHAPDLPQASERLSQLEKTDGYGETGVGYSTLKTFGIFLLGFLAPGLLVPGLLAQAPNDPNQLLARGTALIESKPAEAVKILREALRLDPERGEVRYQLGRAFHAIGDEADAEDELREAAIRMPDSAAVHNQLGIVLFLMGNAKGSIAEFQTAVRLAPGDANAHFNLGEALARTGDTNGAVEELRTAAGLAPGDAGLARLYRSVETKLSAAGDAIRVDVRQVLVPAVVTDKQGHHVTGLTQEDFKVFEDGVEQKIIGFNAETSVPPAAQPSTKGEPSSAAASSPAPAAPLPPVRRTYLILIDTLHSSFNNFVAAREALVKIFRQEHSEDSQYTVVAIGVSPEMVINVTRDPAAVLAALQSKKLQKIFLDGQHGIAAELERFRRDLNETRVACDHANEYLLQMKCEAGMAHAYSQSGQIADLERIMTTEFLAQFRNLVNQLTRARDRRTIVLLSDGFEIVPGREAFDLINAFFPYASHCLVPPNVSCDPNHQQSYERMQEQFEPILQLAARSNITIDTIDSRGLYGQAAFDAGSAGNSANVDGNVGRVERNVAAAQGNTLAEIAGATGGTAFHDSNDLLGSLQRAFADARDFYTIAYVSTNPKLDGKFRAISVQVRDRSRVVNAKRGYWAVPGAQ